MNAVSDKFIDWRDAVADRLPQVGICRAIGIVLGVYLLVTIMLGMFWCISPSLFNVQEQAAEVVAE